jgi:hypothetical protein
MSKLTTDEERTLRGMLDAVEAFTKYDQDMPIQMVRTFLLVALHEGDDENKGKGIGVMQLWEKTGHQSLSVTSPRRPKSAHEARPQAVAPGYRPDGPAHAADNPGRQGPGLGQQAATRISGMTPMLAAQRHEPPKLLRRERL